MLLQGTMVAGWDPTGPGLYYVDSDGQRTKGERFSVGSGSLYAYGILDQGYKWCEGALTLQHGCRLHARAFAAEPVLASRGQARVLHAILCPPRSACLPPPTPPHTGT